MVAAIEVRGPFNRRWLSSGVIYVGDATWGLSAAQIALDTLLSFNKPRSSFFRRVVNFVMTSSRCSHVTQ